MNAPDARVLRVGSASFDTLSGELQIDGRTEKLRPRTASLLAHLVRNAGRMVTKDELMRAVWPDVVVTEDSIVQCVKEIRHALGDAGRDWIRTVPRQGYAFVAPAGVPAAAPRFARWRIVAALLVVAASAALGWRLWPAAPEPALSIVVLPIVNLTGDPAREAAADDLTEKLAKVLWGVQTLKVIAPATAFTFKGKTVDVRRLGSELGVRYVLDGSLRLDAGRPVLKLRLADATSAFYLWSQDFAAADGDDALGGDVMARVANSFGLQLAHVEAQRSQRERPDDPSVTDLLNRARAEMRWSTDSVEAARRARPLVEEVLRRDERQFEAWVILAYTYLMDLRFSAQPEQDLKRAADAAARALELGPDVWIAHAVQAQVLASQRRLRQALAEYERAIELDAHELSPQVWRAAMLTGLGRPQEALAPLERAMQLSPRDPKLPFWQLLRGVAALHLGRDDEAIAWLARSVEGNPRDPLARLFLAAAFGAAGRVEAAREQMAQLQQLRPGFTLRAFRAREPSDEPEFLRQRERVYAGLRAAGMPE